MAEFFHTYRVRK